MGRGLAVALRFLDEPADRRKTRSRAPNPPGSVLWPQLRAAALWAREGELVMDTGKASARDGAAAGGARS